MGSDPSVERLRAALSRCQFLLEVDRRLFRQTLTMATYTPLVMVAMLAMSYVDHKQWYNLGVVVLSGLLLHTFVVSTLGRNSISWLANWHTEQFAAINYIPPDPYRDSTVLSGQQAMPLSMRIALALLRGIGASSRKEQENLQEREANIAWNLFLHHYFGVCFESGKLPLPRSELSRTLGETVGVASILVPLTILGIWLFPDLGTNTDYKSYGVIQGTSLLFAAVWLTYTSCRIGLQRLAMAVALNSHLARLLGAEADLPELKPPPKGDRPQPWA